MNTSHVYEIIINASPETVWQAITDGKITQTYYYASRVESDWKVGSSVCYYTPDETILLDGEVLAIEPQRHLKTTWRASWLGGISSILIWDFQPLGSMTLLKLTQTHIDEKIFQEALMHQGWIFIISSLKSLLETGKALPAAETAW